MRRADRVPRRGWRLNFWTLVAGALLMLWALVNATVTLATGDYRGALIGALGATIASWCFLGVSIVRGPSSWRFAAAVIALPGAFVVMDFVQRAPYVFD
jgi:hypothetical protein